jgi:hypothetical protein
MMSRQIVSCTGARSVLEGVLTSLFVLTAEDLVLGRPIYSIATLAKWRQGFLEDGRIRRGFSSPLVEDYLVSRSRSYRKLLTRKDI